MGKDIKLTASDNFQLGGYRADPATPPKAAIVVIAWPRSLAFLAKHLKK